MKRSWILELFLAIVTIAMYIALVRVVDAVVAGAITLVVVYGAWFVWKRRSGRSS
ncbi:MAG: hypothetical protein JWM25_1152 [Thermoleophilia bacterium]|nr:hypothetical protein [Thermoleophilia bacterium]MCZ4496569.1 hypothetical protein [Thermoleophilia bacterium]